LIIFESHRRQGLAEKLQYSDFRTGICSLIDGTDEVHKIFLKAYLTDVEVEWKTPIIIVEDAHREESRCFSQLLNHSFSRSGFVVS